jgi:fibronectin type 3 domain-containing protein
MRVKSFAIIMLAAAASCSDDENGPVTQTEGGIPANVRAVIYGSTVNLSWDAVEGAVAYNVYMAEVGGVKRVNVGTLPGNMTHSHNNTAFEHPSGLAAALKYYFVVTAVKAGNTESAESCEVTAKIATNEGGSCQ